MIVSSCISADNIVIVEGNRASFKYSGCDDGDVRDSKNANIINQEK